MLSRIRESHQGSIGDDVRVFLDHYLNLIGTRFMNDPKIDELCQRIYKNHRLALQLIYDRAGSPASGPISEVEAALRDDERWHVFYRVGRVVDFVPASWLKWMPPLRADGQTKQAWFVFRFEVGRRLGFLALVQRMEDVVLRKRVVEALLANGKEFGLARKQKEVKPSEHFTRVSSREVLMSWPEDSPPEPERLAAKVRERLDALYPKLQGLPELLIPLLKRR